MRDWLLLQENQWKNKNWWNNETGFTVVEMDIGTMCTCRSKIRLSIVDILYRNQEQEGTR